MTIKKERTTRTTRIPLALHADIKVIAVRTGKRIEDIVKEVLEKEVEKQKKYL